MDRSVCRHKLRSRTRPGQECGEPSDHDFTTRFAYGYCHQHKKSHRDDWIDELKEAQIKHAEVERQLRMQREEEFKLARVPNAATIEENVQFGRAVPEEYYREQLEKTEPTLEACVDYILNTMQRDMFANSININPLSIFTLFPCQWRGWPGEEVATELRNRMYEPLLEARKLTFRARWSSTHRLYLRFGME